MTGKAKTKRLQTRQARRALEDGDIQQIGPGRLRGVERGHGARLLRQAAIGQDSRTIIAMARRAGKLVAQARALADMISLSDPRAVWVGMKTAQDTLEMLKEAVETAAAARLAPYAYEVSVQDGGVLVVVRGAKGNGRAA